MIWSEPKVRRAGTLSTVKGTFFRAVDARYRSGVLSGSTKGGRYSRPGQPTLYLSASDAGVSAAMIAHSAPDDQRVVLAFQVQASQIYDLRVPDLLERVRKDAGDPLSDWQQIVASGGEPPSWRAREWIEHTGARGLIDPSRRAPGLWHLVLFAWDVPDGPMVEG
ncbi:MAG: RES family NAD+ phosphorylase [Sphingobium sp.]